MGQMLREVNAPYTVNADDEAIGRETIIIRRNGEPVAAVVPYFEYQDFLAVKKSLDYAVFQKGHDDYIRLHPKLLATNKGKWVAVLDGKLIDSDVNQWALAERVYRRYGYRPIYMTQVGDLPIRVVQMGGPRVAR